MLLLLSQNTGVFHAGVILFVLVMGRQPFEKACSKDKHYRVLNYDDSRKFWQYHEGRNNTSYIDSDLNDLLT